MADDTLGYLRRPEIFGMMLRIVFVSAMSYYGIKWFMNQVDPTNKSKKSARKKATEQLARLAKSGSHVLPIEKLSDYEIMIASHLIHPEDINVTWSDIAGLESTVQELRETVILPIQRRELFADSQLTQAPKGVLLHGPPGCGKTLIAKATAREAGTCFINLDVSILTDKWYGESQKLAAAVFTLAVKIQPCIIFIDEIDSFLRARNSTDHEATAMMKAQFMSFWDGLITDPNCTVIIMGATNRPQDLDRAILRRMPAAFHIPLPNATQRRQILELILINEPVEDNVDVNKIARSTDGFSGSDLRELCRNASVYRVRDYMKNNRVTVRSTQSTSTLGESEDEFHDALRPISMDDLMISMNKMKESKLHCGSLHTERIDLD
ncbi:outer mitochondrial transmembrane helix translocase-like [Onthophagus taurus]|uniref:outer mitochondrial transmembrane helix translocase-like n=1 Tax=Onthophagus taurus TaxID=166361 RepID=UPI000C205B3A|nr:ATPase family AAA domain-containing protein 1-B-like [Onthophagus taurus]